MKTWVKSKTAKDHLAHTAVHPLAEKGRRGIGSFIAGMMAMQYR